MNVHKDFITGSSKKQEEFFEAVLKIGLDFYNGKLRKNKVIDYISESEVKKQFTGKIPTDSITDAQVLRLLKEVGSKSIAQFDKRFIAFPDSGNSKAAMGADIISKFLNQNMISYDRSSPYGTFIEVQVIEWFREIIGYKTKPVNEFESLAEVGGMGTTGGHMSNHIGIMTALHTKYPQIKDAGLASLKISPKVLYSDKISHYSVSAAFQHLGIGIKNAISVKTNEDFTMNKEDLVRILEEHKKDNDIFMIIAIAGNTRTTSIDDIKEISKICKKYKIWLHVDACHGGSMLFSEKLKTKYLRSIEDADSISIDPHKGMFVTYPSSFVLFKKRDSLTIFTRYPNEVKQGKTWDLGYITPFYGSKAFDSLKVWLMIKSLGRKKLGQIAEDNNDKARYFWNLVNKSKLFKTFHEITMYRMVFIYFPDKAHKLVEESELDENMKILISKVLDKYNHLISQKLYTSGKLCVDEFRLFDLANVTNLGLDQFKFLIMSATINNPLTDKASLRNSYSLLEKEGRKHEEAIYQEIKEIIGQNNHHRYKAINLSGPAGWDWRKRK